MILPAPVAEDVIPALPVPVPVTVVLLAKVVTLIVVSPFTALVTMPEPAVPVTSALALTVTVAPHIGANVPGLDTGATGNGADQVRHAVAGGDSDGGVGGAIVIKREDADIATDDARTGNQDVGAVGNRDGASTERPGFDAKTARREADRNIVGHGDVAGPWGDSDRCGIAACAIDDGGVNAYAAIAGHVDSETIAGDDAHAAKAQVADHSNDTGGNKTHYPR